MKKVVFVFFVYMLSINSLQSQNKSDFERNGVTINFVTTQLGEIENGQFNLVKDMNLTGVFIFIPDKKSVVIRHSNGNDEKLGVLSSKKTTDGNFVFDCNKDRVLFVSIQKKVIFYSIAGNPTVFLFPINERDIASLRTVVTKY